MKEYPIIFSAPMVRAILDGKKTQTRRVMKPQPDEDGKVTVGQIGTSRGIAYVGNQRAGGLVARVPCPYGQLGDRLWVRETWAESFGTESDPDSIVYQADNRVRFHEDKIFKWDNDEPFYDKDWAEKWKPAMFMPRWASRITLEITEIRVQRVQEISAEDCIAEGLRTNLREHDAVCDLRAQYRTLWDSLNAKRDCSWDLNPWVWAVTFKEIKE